MARMTDRLDLPSPYRKVVEALLREHVPDAEVWAYGSRVNGMSHPGSDLDLVVRSPTLEQLGDGFHNLVEAFQESNIPILIQAHDWARLPESFHREIERDYVVVQEGAKQTAPAEWREVVLGDVCTKIGSGATPRGGRDVYLESGPYTLIRSQNVYNAGFSHDGLAYISDEQAYGLRSVEVFPDDVLLNITGDSVARVCQVVPEVLPARVNQHVAIIRTDPNQLDSRFLRYFLTCPANQTMLLSWAGSGGTRNALTKEMIQSMRALVPPLPEQRAIAHILGTLDDKIELNRRMNETLEEIARTLFKSWFVDFDPVRAKMEGRDTGLPPDLAALFPDRLVDSELGEIPEGWGVRALGEVFDLTMGQSPPGNTYNDKGEGLPFFQGRTDFGFRYPGHRKFCTSPTRVAQAGDTLASVRAPVGDINMAWETSCIGRGVAALRHQSGSGSFTYYATWTVQPNLQEYEHTGTVFGAITKKQFEALRVIEPGSGIIRAFDLCIRPLDERIRSSVAESRALAAQRDVLLPGLVSGEVGV